MSKALITEAYLTDIADAIRAKNGSSDTYTPPQMAAAIAAIPTGGITPTGTKNITQNGTHDVTQYASANVNVQPNLQSKTVAQNGTVTPDQGYDGLSSVVVNVSGANMAVAAELCKYAVLSKTSEDKFTRSNRYFTRNSNEPIIAMSAAYFDTDGTTILYSGYGCVSFSSSGVSGTYTSYGDLTGLAKKTTPNGTDYWIQCMTSMIPPSTSSNRVQINYDSTSQLYFAVDSSKIVLNAETGAFVGSADLISAMYALIDSVYQTYYAGA